MIDRLELLLALAREQHFGRAAEACGVSQQTLSAALKQLEERMGVLLVRRGSRFQGFTPEGECVLDWARRIVGDARAMQQELRGFREGLSGHLRLATVPTALPRIGTLTGPFMARHPAVRFTIHSATSAEILLRLRDLEIDAGITYLDNEPLGRVATLPLYDEHYCLLVAPDGALAGRASVSWAEAAALPLCLLTPDMQNRRIIDQHLGAGRRPPAVESNSVLLLLQQVRAGICASIMPSAFADAAGPGSVRCIPITEPAVTHRIGLVVPQRDPMLPSVAALLRLAQGLAAEGAFNKEFLSTHPST
ncbi:LysR family transcriptional regulator [Teichococcus oryzae]|uniref:LysR family transcriptional regulator n=1 Tax=Teichococcus oryzae TaxID=1608942 RepID=A0A5B2TH40_9PROT|nr:LysR family transcriptional regulator [Pseudoroseomonas oryzae]KAA2213519.1 LysR family transcriptional regulator [Pseudoroseomonas oryzae]